MDEVLMNNCIAALGKTSDRVSGDGVCSILPGIGGVIAWPCLPQDEHACVCAAGWSRKCSRPWWRGKFWR